MAFPDGFVDEVRRAADIVRVISDHVGLRKVGASWKGLCPFHQEKTPSFNVRAEPPLFHCFGCGEGGDVFKFVMLHERVAFPEALEIVARRFGVPIPEGRHDAGPDRKEREEMLALMEAAAAHFARTLWTAGGTRAREYLLGRGFKKETLEKIRAGAARDSWDDLANALKGRFSPQALVAAGLLVPGQDGKRPYDRFRNRAVFPILNESGKVVAFGARSLDGSEPKYLNSPESPVYQKSRTLYGLSWARGAIGREGRAVLMEGYLDVARALEHDVEEAVATCGTALTSGHARLLRRFTGRVIVNFDQDDAGQKASRKSLDVLIDEGLQAHVVELPAGDDPDTYLKANGGEAYRSRLAEAPAGLHWLIRRAAAEHDLSEPAGKAAYLEAILPSLARVENAVERMAWVPHVVEAGGLDARAAREELRRAVLARERQAPAAASAAPARASARPVLLTAEKLLLTLILDRAPGVDEALGELGEEDLAGLAAEEALRAARALYLRGASLDAATLREAIAGDETRRLVTEMAVRREPTGDATALACVREIQCRRLQGRIAEIQSQLERAPGDAVDALFREQLHLKQKMAALSRGVAAGS